MGKNPSQIADELELNMKIVASVIRLYKKPVEYKHCKQGPVEQKNLMLKNVNLSKNTQVMMPVQA